MIPVIYECREVMLSSNVCLNFVLHELCLANFVVYYFNVLVQVSHYALVHWFLNFTSPCIVFQAFVEPGFCPNITESKNG